MQVFQRRNNLGSIKLCVLLRQTFPRSSLQSPEELSSHTVVQNKEQVVVGLERVEESDDERMVGRGQNLLFC